MAMAMAVTSLRLPAPPPPPPPLLLLLPFCFYGNYETRLLHLLHTFVSFIDSAIDTSYPYNFLISSNALFPILIRVMHVPESVVTTETHEHLKLS